MRNKLRKPRPGYIYCAHDGYRYAVISVYDGVAHVISELGNAFYVDDARVYRGLLWGSGWHSVNNSGAADYQRIEEMEELLNV